MKYYFTVLLFLSSVATFVYSQPNEKELLSDIRDRLQYAFNDDKVCTALYEKFRKVSSNDPLLKGYIGGLYIARSRHVGLLDKPSNFRTGKAMLEEAIKLKPHNIELIFLRLTIQLNLPGFLGYNDRIEDDKKFVLANYRTAPGMLRKRMAEFIKNSDGFSESEKEGVEL